MPTPRLKNVPRRESPTTSPSACCTAPSRYPGRSCRAARSMTVEFALVTHRRAGRVMALQFIFEEIGQYACVVVHLVARRVEQRHRAACRPVQQALPVLGGGARFAAVGGAELVEGFGAMGEGLAQLTGRSDIG